MNRMNSAGVQISVVIPLLNEEESLTELYEWIARVMQEHGFTFEVVFVNDGSTDRSWDIIRKLAAEHDEVKGISFNRNYGKAAALNVGFRQAMGDVVITMDADLQDSPDEIPDLYRMITEDDYDLVSGWKKKRFDPITKTIPTKLYNAVTRSMSGIQLNDFNCGLKAYKRVVVKNVEIYGEMHRYIPVIAKWRGFSKIGEKVVQHRARKYGHTKFGLSRFIYGPLDLLSISFVTRFKKRPMHFFGVWGLVMFMLGFGISTWLVIEKFYKSKVGLPVRDVVDQPLFFLALVVLLIGVQLFLAGYLSELINSNADKSNDYIVASTVDKEGEKYRF